MVASETSEISETPLAFEARVRETSERTGRSHGGHELCDFVEGGV